MHLHHSAQRTDAAPDGPAVFVVEEQPNASTDYFIGPALSALGAAVTICRPDEVPAAEDLEGAVVVLVRYVPAQWLKLIESARARVARVIFFMDDDVLDWRASSGMPLRYRFKLVRLAAARKEWLARNGADLWVSTPHLQQKYAEWRPRLVPPSPVAAVESTQVFYHGTASHGAEIRWLRPVIEGIVAQDSRISFEIVGGQDVHRLYRGMPRVRVVHPMKWPAYQSLLAGGVRHIGLAPLLDLPFNRARSFTKFFDITRAGAAGIYSPRCACAEVVEHGVDGLVVPLQQEAWARAILGLAQDPGMRASLARHAAQKADRLAALARVEYSSLLESH